MSVNLKNAKIVYVDGFAIRNSIDPNFEIVTHKITDLGLPYPKFFIPKREVWIDYPLKAETDFLLQIEQYYIDPKNDKEIAKYQSKEGYVDEQRGYIKKLCTKGKAPEYRKEEKEIEGVGVVLVDGSIVRKYIDPEFTFGGHGYVYSYIPKAEVWIDIHMDPRETKYTILHEIVERKLMKDQGKTYDSAHDYAIVAEKEARTKDGFGNYSDYSNFKWRGLTNKQIIKRYFLIKKK